MEELLKRLLEAEARAAAEVSAASAERERTIRDALEQVRRADQQFAEGVGELRAPYLRQAEERAAQAIGELNRKYEERRRHLRALAEHREAAAVQAALDLLVDPSRN
jgi:V/A-type H+/Na+-transporting ATPase subunit G/H